MDKKEKQYLLYGVIVLLVFKVFHKAVSQVQTDISGQIDQGRIQTQTGISVPRQNQLAVYAHDLQNAIWGWFEVPLFGWSYKLSEDEEKMITTLNKCLNGAEAKLLSELFLLDYPSGAPEHKGLKQCCDNYLSSSQKNQIKAVVYSNLT